jgi:hypothetical protein
VNKTLHNQLMNGGYILYIRHGEATIGNDLANLNFNDCYTQRNLSDLGREQAIYYGEMMRYLRIPINYPVFASPFCRTIETAQLAFGWRNVFIDPFWFEIYKLGENPSIEEQQSILDSLHSELEIIPSKGNKVIIAHGFPDGIGLGEITNMGTVIVKPLGPNIGYEIIAKLSLTDLSV